MLKSEKMLSFELVAGAETTGRWGEERKSGGKREGGRTGRGGEKGRGEEVIGERKAIYHRHKYIRFLVRSEPHSLETRAGPH